MQHQWPSLYVRTLTALLTRPGTFFANGFAAISMGQATAILIVSGLFFAVSGTFMAPGTASVSMGVIWFVNAIGMVAIATAIGYVALATTAGRRYAFSRLWRIFSLSSGTVLLIAWVPSAFLLTEPWKWWLIGTGMVKGLGMSKLRAVITVLFTFGATVMLIYWLLPLAHSLKSLAA
ncbi:hypothetical protein [Desulfosarcina ovata]|uniref:Yip1 domain-containing protein n=2 Tax=Desulfosarcina ovata TaxID=83564 RepID=A0A5K8A3Q8_9BACT|nr:hypothetical protein [Desulfosarcina ovata]BBO80396.1 hypothetical protein DSCO28_09620 [Desulfosarcina ovata subsp. sediminis]BBO87066.1 hypothetical protein DSCOOX_02460 [Desulfosarcina ovata subsp. ovata]